MKLLFWPGLVWWILGYFLYAKLDDIPASKWLSSAAAGLFLYPYIKTARSTAILAVWVLILFGALFIVFTFSPPQIPLYEDPVAGSYGI